MGCLERNIMLGGQWRGCQASVILARVSRKENARALSSLSTSISESRISSNTSRNHTKTQIREHSKVAYNKQVKTIKYYENGKY